MNIKKIGAMLLATAMIIALLPYKTSYAADNGVVTIRGLEDGDYVEIYRIANYSETAKDYTWANAVETWVASEKAGAAYQGLQPKNLKKMSDVGAKEFCEVLIMSLKNDSTGVANLSGETFVVEKSENKVSLSPGYYILLPKGDKRIYELKWFILESAGELTIEYAEEDYSSPEISSEAENTTAGRGKSFDHELTLIGDSITVTANVVLPQYTGMYSPGKRIANIGIIFPRGIDPDLDSLKLSVPSDAYSKQVFSGSMTYVDHEGNYLFFGKEGYFYQMDGSKLAGPDATADDALEAYNSIHDTEYVFEDNTYDTITDLLPTDEEELAAYLEEQAREGQELKNAPEIPEDTGLIETQSIEPEEEVDKSNWVYTHKGLTVIIISLDTDLEIEDVDIEIKSTKSKYSSDTGDYDITTLLTYSTSPLDTNLHSLLASKSIIASYGIRITACMGVADSYLKTPDEILRTATRMTMDEFSIYKKVNEYEGNVVEADEILPEIDIEDASTLPQEPSADDPQKETIRLFDEGEYKTYEYELFALLETDEEGQISVAGLEPTEYLIIQTDHSPGYGLSTQSLLIEETDWTDSVIMEGNSLFDILWLDYKTVFLPATGSTRQEVLKTWGSLLLLAAAMGFARVYRKNITIH